ncbi:MAG: DsrE/DsrF/TusD sulfur relay family protein [Promethearchaeota archaeon]
MVLITIFVGTGAYTTERPYTALRFAYTALLDENEVKMFFFEDGIFTLKKNQNPSNTYNIQEWVQNCFDEKGFEIAACGVCMKARGVDPKELIDGVQTGTMEKAVEWTIQSDKQLFF